MANPSRNKKGISPGKELSSQGALQPRAKLLTCGAVTNRCAMWAIIHDTDQSADAARAYIEAPPHEQMAERNRSMRLVNSYINYITTILLHGSPLISGYQSTVTLPKKSRW